MDNIYSPQYKEVTQIKSKFQQYNEILKQAKEIPRNDAEVMIAMEFDGTPEEFDALDQSISTDFVDQPDDIPQTIFNPSLFMNRKRTVAEIPKKALATLKTVRAYIELQPKFHLNHKQRYMKYNKYRYVTKTVDNANANINVYGEILIVVRVYEPFKYKPISKIRMKPKLSQQFSVLGSQLLTVLRDQIQCESKHGPFYDISDTINWNEEPDPMAEKPFDHGFFYITDTFYNDNRQPTIDYSEPIREWAKNNPEVGDMKTDSMETTKFEDLTVRLGAPCLYQHHGNCEHLFTFSDIRFIDKDDSLVYEDYPMLNIVSDTNTIFCMICGAMQASIVVSNSTAHIHDPAYMCNGCFKSYHYLNGKKIGTFQAYRHFNRELMLEQNKE